MRAPAEILRSVCLITFAFSLFVNAAWGQTESLINYQGKLLRGTNPVSGTANLTFKVYTVQVGGEPIYEESQKVEVINGLYSTMLGQNPVKGDLNDAAQTDVAYLEVSVDGNPLRPREKFAPPPFAKKTTEVWRMFGSGPINATGTNCCGGLSWQHLISGLGTICMLRHDVSVWTNFGAAFPIAREKKEVISVAYNLLYVTGSNAPGATITVEVHDLSDNIIRTVSSSPVAVSASSQTNVWEEMPLSNIASNRIVDASNSLLVIRSQTTAGTSTSDYLMLMFEIKVK